MTESNLAVCAFCRLKLFLRSTALLCFISCSFPAALLALSSTPLLYQPLSPSTKAPGGSAFTLTVHGTGFVSGASVEWNGTPRTTTFVNSSTLTAQILAADISAPGTALITVLNPSPGGGLSNPVFFEVSGPTPTLSFTKVSLSTGNSPRTVTYGDFNGDGKLDLAIANYMDDTISILLGNGDGTFQNQITYTVGNGPYAIITSDFNKDGRLDLAIANNGSGTVSILLGNGDGTFQSHVDYQAGLSSVGLATADFNGDGFLDLCVVDLALDQVSVLLGNGNGTFKSPVTYAAGAFPISVSVGDFNGDGKLDLVVANNNFGSTGGTVSVLLGNGDGTFQAQSQYNTGNNPDSVVVADFNGDGKLDVAVANETDSTVSVLLGNGNGTFQNGVAYATATTPSALALADFNGDGIVDIAAAAAESAEVSILLGVGNGTFEAASTFATGIEPLSITAADFDNDGAMDFVTANFNQTNATIFTQISSGSPSPNSINFGNQTVGTSSGPQTVTLSNTGSATLPISGLTFTGSNSKDFSQSNTCGSYVLPNSSCTISITFTPSAEGARKADLQIAEGSSNQYITLSGTGLAPLVTVSPTSLSFPNTQVGSTSSPLAVTVTNAGNTSLTFTSFSTTGNFAETNTCGSGLAAGKSCAVNVTFSPTGEGTRNGTLKISDNAGNGQQSVSLTGTGLAPLVTLSPASLSFPNTQVGSTSSPMAVTVTNTGNASLTFTSFNATGNFAETNTCGSSLAAGKSCTVNVTFSPTGEGTRNGTLKISDNAGNGQQSVSLTGTGLAPLVTLSPTSITFPTTTVGKTSSPITATVTNSGNAALSITSITASGNFAETNTCGSSLGAGKSCTLSVTFTPKVTGVQTGKVTLNDNAGTGQQKVSLTGTGQ